MKPFLSAILPGAVAAIVLFAGHPVGAQGVETVNGIAALVGNSVITREQVERVAFRAIQTYRGQFANQPQMFRQRVDGALREGLDRLIERRLILQEAENLNLNIPESIVEDRVQAEIKEIYTDRATLTRSLQEQGLTLESFRREIREQFIEAVMRNRHVPRDILVSPGRIERYYRDHEDQFRVLDQVKLRMIVLDRTRNPVDAVRLAREILTKLDEGAEFAEMASVYSDGSQAREGGLWGWVDRKVLREDLAELAFQLPAGRRSDLIEKPEAVYLMLVEEVRTAHVRPITEVRGEIERTLLTAERGRLEQQWLERLRKKAFIRYFWIIPTSQPAVDLSGS